MAHRTAALAALLMSTACVPRKFNANSTGQGLTTDPSNLELPTGAVVEGFRFLDNTYVPKGIVVSASLQGDANGRSDDLPLNAEYLHQLYRIVKSINESDRLSGLDGPNQEITLALMVPLQVAGQKPEEVPNVKALLAEIRAEFGFGEKIPHLLLFPGGDAYFPWIQDLGEMGVAKLQGTERFVPAFLDTHYWGPSAQSVENAQVKAMRDAFRLPITKVRFPEGAAFSGGNHGGNLEATPAGDVLAGNRISSELEQILRDTTGKKVIKVPVDFLLVGHVDEIFSFIPSRGACGQSLVYADALEGLQAVAQERGNGWDPSMQDLILDSLRYFYRGDLSQALQIQNFDTNRPARRSEDTPDFPHYGDFLTLGAVEAQKQIQAGLKIIRENVTCLDAAIPLPVFYFNSTESGEYQLGDQLTAATPFVNHIVLRDHLVLHNPMSRRMKRMVEDRLGNALGGKNKVHFIDTGWYDLQMGSAHCSSLVVRDPEHRVTFAAGVDPEVREAGIRAKVTTWFKHTTGPASSLPASRRCKIEPGQRIFTDDALDAIGRATHVRLTLTQAIPGCPAGAANTRGYVWGEHFER